MSTGDPSPTISFDVERPFSAELQDVTDPMKTEMAIVDRAKTFIHTSPLNIMSRRAEMAPYRTGL
jgi:hypothetical protein